MNDLRDIIDNIEREIALARDAIARDRQVTSDRDLSDARRHLNNVRRQIERGRQDGVLPKW